MLAEIIANGDEITSGKILDTNSQWLSRELEALGVSVLYHTAVGDELESMVHVLQIAMNRADIVITTGGLGPTADDLTRQAFADAVGVPLLENAESRQHLEEIYARRGTEIPPNARTQMFLPKGASPIRNPNGTAPGIDLTVKRPVAGDAANAPTHTDFVRLLAYPGVPAEMVEMWNDTGRQTILALHRQLKGEQHTIKDRLIHSFGLGESVVENMLSGLVARDHIPKVGITATQGTITLRIVAEAESEDQCVALIEPVAMLIYETLGDRIFGEGTDTLADVVCRIVKFQNKKIAVVESGTRGLLAAALGGSAESAACFLGGIVVPPRTPITPERMIEIGRKMFDADYLLLIGAYPEGQPGRTRSEEVFVAVVDVGDSQASILRMRSFPFVGHPGIIDDLYVKRVLDVFRLL
ncbi:MAG: molybdopterin-binding protein [Planctomycetaceae bacterium]|nr:molybdopterin-binding protein [Planctomycetaceae bacterium]